jgi:hypothetical protein
MSDDYKVKPLVFDGGGPAKSVDFDYESVDSPEDQLKERLALGFAELEIVEEYVREASRIETKRLTRKIISAIMNADEPKYFACRLAWLSGMAAEEGFTLPYLAQKCKVSKQAFQQACERTAVEFKFPKTSAQRSEQARENMRRAFQPKPA